MIYYRIGEGKNSEEKDRDHSLKHLYTHVDYKLDLSNLTNECISTFR